MRNPLIGDVNWWTQSYRTWPDAGGRWGLIERLTSDFQDRGIVLGAGTVLDGYAAYEAISAGAQLLVSPHLSRDVLKVALRYPVAAMPGADVVKLFPAEILGPPLSGQCWRHWSTSGWRQPVE